MNTTIINNLNQLIKLYKLAPHLRQLIINAIKLKPAAEKIYFMKGCTVYTYNKKLNILKTKSGCGCGR